MSALAALALAGVAVHVWFALGADALDTDRATVILMARAFAAGEWSLYFWQQNYMAALEPLLLTPLAVVGHATPVAAGMVGVALTTLLATLSVQVTRRLGGVPWVTVLLWAIPPAVVVHHHVALYGARLAATLLCVAAFAGAVRGPATARAWAGIGALVGVAWLGDHLMLPWVVAVLWVSARKGGIRPVLLGALPWVLADTAAAMATPAFHLSGPNDPGDWIHNIPLLFGTTLPQLFGLFLSRGPGPLFEAPASVVPPLLPWLLFAVPGAAALAAMGVTLARRRRELFGAAAGAASVPAQALLAACAVGLGLFALVGGGGDRWPVRYLIPFWPALSVLAALAVARWRPRRRILAVAAVLPALFTLAADDTWPRGSDGGGALEEAAAVERAVASSGAEAVWADYWDTYRLALLTGTSVPWAPVRVIERRHDWREEALSASPAAYLLRSGDRETQDILTRASERGNHQIEEQQVGRFQLVLMERAVPETILMNPAPPRAWQMLAALAAGLLFPGGAIVVVVLSRIRRDGG